MYSLVYCQNLFSIISFKKQEDIFAKKCMILFFFKKNVIIFDLLIY